MHTTLVDFVHIVSYRIVLYCIVLYCILFYSIPYPFLDVPYCSSLVAAFYFSLSFATFAAARRFLFDAVSFAVLASSFSFLFLIGQR
jgi:hypothetical protein